MRKGDFTSTYTGIHFYPLDPHPDDIDIRDVAHALSNICRYNGHSKFHYSVCQHSIMVAKAMEEWGYSTELQLFGLLHDASEAYICDIPRPLKPYLTNYGEIEKKIQDMVYTKFCQRLPEGEEHDIIKTFDDEALMAECRDIMGHCDWAWKDSIIAWSCKPSDPKIDCLDFLILFYKLINKLEEEH